MVIWKPDTRFVFLSGQHPFHSFFSEFLVSRFSINQLGSLPCEAFSRGSQGVSSAPEMSLLPWCPIYTEGIISLLVTSFLFSPYTPNTPLYTLSGAVSPMKQPTGSGVFTLAVFFSQEQETTFFFSQVWRHLQTLTQVPLTLCVRVLCRKTPDQPSLDLLVGCVNITASVNRPWESLLFCRKRGAPH